METKIWNNKRNKTTKELNWKTRIFLLNDKVHNVSWAKSSKAIRSEIFGCWSTAENVTDFLTSADKRYSLVTFKTIAFITTRRVSVKKGLNNVINILYSNTVLKLIFKALQRSFAKLKQWSKNWGVATTSRLQLQNGFRGLGMNV